MAKILLLGIENSLAQELSRVLHAEHHEVQAAAFADGVLEDSDAQLVFYAGDDPQEAGFAAATRADQADELARGRSTFMVEMSETANILNNATGRSLVILDEVGRGTSTFDGVALAWAATEHIAQRLRCRTLFATHYHELTELADVLPGVANFNVAVREWQDQVVFLHKIIPGGTDKSYGVHVARLAGVPREVVDRARAILADLEAAHLDPSGRPKLAAALPKTAVRSVQLTFFEGVGSAIADELRRMDLDTMTPIDALNKLKELKQRL